MTLSISDINIIKEMTELNYVECCYAECRYAECRHWFIVVRSVVKLNIGIIRPN
jgi:hypothetical protein